MIQTNHKSTEVSAGTAIMPATGQKSFWTISRKLLFPILAVIILLSTSLIFNNYYTTVQRYNEQERNSLEQIQAGILNEIDGINQVALALAVETANNPEVQAAFANGDRARLTEIMLPTFKIVNQEFSVKQFTFQSPPATNFLRLQQLDQFGDDLSAIRKMVVDANAEQKTVQGLEIGRAGLGARGVVPVIYQNKHIGVVDVGIDIGQSLLDTIKKRYKVDAQFLLDSKSAESATFTGFVENVVGPTSGLLLQASTLAEPIYAKADTYPQVLAGETALSYQDMNNRNYAILSFPLKDYSNSVIGVLEIIVDRTDAVAAQNRVLVSTVFASLLAIIIGSILIVRSVNAITRPIGLLTESAIAVSNGNLELEALVQSDDEIGALTKAFNRMTQQLRDLIGTLEQRVAERTAKMERRNLDLALATEIGQSVSQVREINSMLKDAAEIMRVFFGLYYVQVYLVNPAETELVLQFGTGTVGEELIKRRHRLPLNENSINGRAALTKRSVVIADTATSATFRPNPLLPNTRSEIAVPLLVGDKLIGVLDVQSEKAGLLNEDALLAFEPMSGQMAVAIQNSRLITETQQARAEVESLVRRLTQSNWEEYLDAIHQPEKIGFMFANDTISPLTDQEQIADEDTLAAPITITGETFGSLMVELEQEKRHPRTDELVNAVARQVSQQIENLRLLDSAERFRFEAEEASRRITHKGWKDYMNTSEGLNYIYDLKEVRLLNQGESQQTDESALRLPIKVRDETVGKLIVQGIQADDSQSIDLATAVAERLGAHIEGLRLSKQTEQALATTQKLAEREQALRQITSAVRGSTDPATILRSAARELGAILGRKTIVRLATTTEDPAPPHLPTNLVEDAIINNGGGSISPVASPNADGGNQ